METTETAAIVQALRTASAASAHTHAKAVDAAFELLVSTHSLATTQHVITAEFLGFALTQQLFRSLDDGSTQRVQQCQQTLIDVFNANSHVFPGVVAAVESKQSPLRSSSSEAALLALQAISPLCMRIFIGADESCQTKLALLHVLQRVAWQNGAPLVTRAITRLFVTALGLTPRRVDAVQSYTALVSATVDLLVETDETASTESTQMIRDVCEQLVARTRFFATHESGVLQLLQSLVQLAEFAPDALWSSRFLFACAHLLTTACDASLEKQLLLDVLRPVLAFGRDHDDRPTRSVYVECLVLPLISVLSTHSETARPLLQLAIDLRSRRRFAAPDTRDDRSAPQDEATVHLDSFLHLVGDEAVCRSWLETLFADSALDKKRSVLNNGDKESEELWLSLLLGTLLFDDRRALRESALAALERQVRDTPKFWSAPTTKLLVSTLVFLASQRPTDATLQVCYAAFVSRVFFVLAALAASTTDTMKIVLRLIKRMHAVASMRGTALRLLFVVWERESRVYPRLEALLHEERDESDVEYDLVKVATIASLCERDAEIGVEYIGQIQAFLEDARASVVAMAMDAIASLCRADCLDFYAAFKSIALKTKKKKIQCVHNALFLERLCVFYALGAVEMDANKRQADKLLAHLWELVENEAASVRALAYESLNAYSLQALGLCVDDSRNAGADDSDEDDEDDEVTEDDVAEKLDKLVEALASEDAADVRGQIETLLTRVLEFESTKLTSGSGRGQTAVSSTVDDQRLQQRVSAAATKELKKKLPSCREVTEQYDDEERRAGAWDAFLIAYEEKEAVEYSSVKRKDKLVKLASQNVADMEAKLTVVLAHQIAPWVVDSDASSAFLRVLSLMEGWQAFMSKYVDAVDELSTLKLTIGASAEDGDEFFVDHIRASVASLLQDASVGREREQLEMVVLGALVGQLRDSKRWAAVRVIQFVQERVETMVSRLKRAMEEAKVFPHEKHHEMVLSAVIGLHLALGHRALDASKEKATDTLLGRLEAVLTTLLHASNHALVQTVAATALSHLGWLYAIADAVGSDRRTALSTAQTRVECVARAVLSLWLRSVCPESRRSSIVDCVFSSDQLRSEDLLALSTPSSSDVAVTWASLMGLARLSSSFARVQRLGWLTNLKDVLNHVWRQSGDTGVVGVALGPVLLACVSFHLAAASEAEEFVRESIDRLQSSGSSRLGKSFLSLVAYYMMCQMPALGCAAPQEQLQTLVQHTQASLSGEKQSDLVRQLALTGLTNYFQSSLGIHALGAGPTRRRAFGTVQLASELCDIEALVECVRSAASAGDECAQFAFGSIATASDLFYVAQKKRSFDAEIASLPSKGLLSKIMETLRQAQSGTDGSTQRDYSGQTGRHLPRPRLVRSLLSCLTATSASLPLFDFESLVHRLTKRFCDVDVTVGCIAFALTQGICDVYVVKHVYARESFANLHPRVQSEGIAGLLRLAGRVATDTLERIVTTVSDVVLGIWRHERLATELQGVIDAWIDVLGKLLERGDGGARISPESRDMVKRAVVQQILPRLPFAEPTATDSARLVRAFAREVLARIPRQDGVEEFVLGGSTRQGAQLAAIFAELLRSGAVFAPERQTAVVAQWIVRQDFAQWTKSSVETRVQLVHELSSFVSIAGPDGSPSQDAVSWLLEVVDALRRSLTTARNGDESAATSHALFVFLASVCAWTSSLSFERHSALQATGISPFVRVFPVELLRSFGANASLSAVVEQLWKLLPLVQDTAAAAAIGDLDADAIDYNAALRVCARQAHLQAGARATQRVQQSVLQYWSVDGFQ